MKAKLCSVLRNKKREQIRRKELKLYVVSQVWNVNR